MPRRRYDGGAFFLFIEDAVYRYSPSGENAIQKNLQIFLNCNYIK